MDITKLVEDMNLEIRSKNSARFSERIYTDEPIIRTAASLIAAEPPEYRMMRKLGVTFSRSFHTESRIFYEQAKLMEQFEDQFQERVSFSSFFPTYRVMSLRQQRTYFTWRTKVRNGILTPTDVSYVLVYLYELLNLIGVQTPEEAFQKITEFVEAYDVYDSEPKRYAEMWLHDLVVYYGLPAELLRQKSPVGEIGRHFETIANPDACTDEELFSAMQGLSTYTVENSRFFKANAPDYIVVSAAVFREMTAYFEKNRKNSYFDIMIGKQRALPYEMFSCAVFYDRRRFEERSYECNALDRYVCSAGRWYRYSPMGGESKSKQLGAFLRNVDAIMREEYGFPFELKRQAPTKMFVQIVREQIRRLSEKKAEAERRVVTIDFSALEQIRAASEATKEKILTQEERTDESEVVPPVPTPAETPADTPDPDPRPENALPALTRDEADLLSLLLQGADPAPVFRNRGVLLSVVADGINDRLFDLFADTVIEFDGDTPVIVEDYRSDLQGLADRSDESERL